MPFNHTLDNGYVQEKYQSLDFDNYLDSLQMFFTFNSTYFSLLILGYIALETFQCSNQ